MQNLKFFLVLPSLIHTLSARKSNAQFDDSLGLDVEETGPVVI